MQEVGGSSPPSSTSRNPRYGGGFVVSSLRGLGLDARFGHLGARPCPLLAVDERPQRALRMAVLDQIVGVTAVMSARKKGA